MATVGDGWGFRLTRRRARAGMGWAPAARCGEKGGVWLVRQQARKSATRLRRPP